MDKVLGVAVVELKTGSAFLGEVVLNHNLAEVVTSVTIRKPLRLRATPDGRIGIAPLALVPILWPDKAKDELSFNSSDVLVVCASDSMLADAWVKATSGIAVAHSMNEVALTKR